MKRWRLWLGLALAASVTGMGCHKSSTIGLTITPTTATVLINNTAQFEPTVTGSTNTTVWSVNNVSGGNTTVGTINSNGLYTAPASVPNPATVTITGTVSGTSVTATATVTIVSGIQVSVAPSSFTVGTSESFPFVATVFGVPVNAVTSTCNSSNSTSSLPPCTAVTWSVVGGGTVGPTTGIYTAPSTVTASVVTVTATSVFDSAQTATAVVTLVAATDPTLASVSPNTGARGATFQDAYLSGTNFISTTDVFINGVQVPTADILVSSVTCATLTTTNSSGTSVPIPPCTTASLTAGSTVLRVRIPDIFLATALTLPSTNSVSLTFTASRQNGPVQACSPNSAQCQLILSPQRPVIVGTTPDSIAQGIGSAFSFSVNGGFFGTPLNPLVTAQFGGQPIFPTISSVNADRQLSVTVPGNAATQAGLYEVGVASDTSGIAPATSNLAIQTAYSSSPTAIATLPVGTTPQAIAINSATGIAAVVNSASNDLYLIDLTQATPAVVAKICTAAVTGAPGTVEPTCATAGPTGVAVDNLRNIALVVNGGTNTIAVVDLQGQKVTQILSPGTVLNSTTIPQVPTSVGINPVTGRAIIAYKGTNFGLLLDTTTLNTAQCPVAEPQCIAGIVNISTGANPRVAVSPKLNWALVTPGSLGSMSIVNLSQQTSNALVSATPSNGVVTVITATTHTLQVGQPVLITGFTGANDSTFNGLQTVITVPSSTSFTYTQPSTLSNTATTGTAGVASYGIPIATVATSLTTTGIAVNDQTSKAFLADPGLNGTPATIFSILDQSSSSLASGTIPGTGTIGAAFNPLTNIAVTVNQTNNTGYVIDPTTPTTLTSFPVGHNPWDVAIDAGSNLAVVINQGDNTVSIVPLGAVRTPQVLQVSPAQIYINSTLTQQVPTTGAPSTLTIVGKGFSGSSVARLDGVPLTTASVTDRVLTANVPASMLTAAHEFTLDVSNAGVLSNGASLQVIQAVNVSGFGCASPAPTGVAIDTPNNLAVVSDPNCNEVYLINLATGTGQVVSVGTSPLGVAVAPQGGFAVVANTGSNNISFVDDLNADVTQTLITDANPSGVAIDPVLGEVIVTASGSASVDTFSVNATSSTQLASTPVQQGPVPVAVDPVEHIAAVGNESSNTVSLVTLVAGATTALQTPSISLPTGIVYEPISDQFIVASSVTNQFELLNPNTGSMTPVRVGINPTSLAYNYATSTLVTTNTAGQNMTVVDFVTGTVRQVFPLSSSGQFSVALHPLTNLAVVADATNSRVLFVPIP